MGSSTHGCNIRVIPLSDPVAGRIILPMPLVVRAPGRPAEGFPT